MLPFANVVDDRTNGISCENEKREQNEANQVKRLSHRIVHDESPTGDTTTLSYPSIMNVTLSTTEVQATKPQLVESAIENFYPDRIKTTISMFLNAMVKLTTRDLPLRHSPRLIQAMGWRERICFYLTNPEKSYIGWRLQQIIMFLLVINVGVMASETLDGPQYGSTDPAFAYMLSESAYNDIETLFSLLYITEFLVRWYTVPKRIQFLKSVSTWIYFLAAVAALPKLVLPTQNKQSDTMRTDSISYNLRILRAVRLIVAVAPFVGTKVLLRAIAEAIAPLKITLFFLIAVVMVFATAIFYAEPCYDLQTCTFTDIFNTGYFVMLTVSTVGYGSQVPSMNNFGSLLLVCLVMIFGTIYFSMPLAIVGIKYDLAWLDHDEHLANVKQEQSRLQNDCTSSEPVSSGDVLRPQSFDAYDDTTKKVDDTLEKVEAHVIQYTSLVTSDRFYTLLQGLFDANSTLQGLLSPNENALSSSTTLESLTQISKRRNDKMSQAVDVMVKVIEVHSKICLQTQELLEASTDRENDFSRFMSTSKFESKTISGTLSKRMIRAKGAIDAIKTKAMSAISRRDSHTNPNSFRAYIWNVLEYRLDTWHSRVINKTRMIAVVLSIAMFYMQTTPELQNTGIKTFLCLRNVYDHCERYDELGCYVFRQISSSGSELSVEVTTQRLSRHCSIGDKDETCYGSGVNFASENFPLACTDVFPSRSGIEHVCKNRLCNPPVLYLFDMEPYWIYFEILFGFLFTLESVMRVYAHPVRRHLWGDYKLMVNVLVLLPFYVEIVEIMIGEWPTYAVGPAIPSFFTAVRILKSLRILKLGSHIPGARVLIQTAQLVSERLVIPLFFLFLGCVISAAVFFELERGTECFVGQTCMWWHINVLTPELSEGLPIGKRILIQNTLPSIITDMMRSTWFSLVSFTTVGYGDLRPRTSLGKLVDIIGVIFSSCYTAMPLTLVGGQFYVCYELHAQKERLKKESLKVQIVPCVSDNDNSAEVESEAKKAISNAIETSTTSLSRSNSTVCPLNTVQDEEVIATQRNTRLTEEEIIQQFFLMQKVFHEMIDDISILIQLRNEQFNLIKKQASDDLTLSRQREEVIKTKILVNLDFCLAACLNFSAMIERCYGSKRAPKPLPSIAHHTNALLAAADVSNKLLQANTDATLKPSQSRRSLSWKNSSADLAMPRLQPKRTLKKIATLSKVLAVQYRSSGNITDLEDITDPQNEVRPE
ncbi:voltage-gated ion channel superfamily [Plasmopara halstedii]|uniref:Voltage-gated ion channel superfamily n=1 Tax=Plasmopara halstedii TaxID=4781 RepID=A0A0P1APZ5_PLAHL|nr:voltage-gated ion channel superfamily [Plasmopara halstedii]CEG43438.1 voltage-gated ion channel superfamily [Plasmopara halstedii]|eukprot:XP_024579807.1 voltage-gated ion channel superfamily [Plasmopara halstedii]